VTRLMQFAVALALTGLAWRPGLAQDANPDVARLSFVEGEVSVTDGGSGEWGTGQVNAPLVGGDEVVTASGARAELQLDSQNTVRLDGETQMRLATFTREQVTIELSRGRIAYALAAAPVVPVQIAAPNVTFQPNVEGFYVIAVAPDGMASVTVRRGQGVVVKGDEQRNLVRGQTAVIAAGEGGDIRIVAAAFPDAWESWVIQREDQVRGAQSWGNLNRNYVGAQDLDHHGEWREAPNYGRVWVPRAVGPDWAPYREGYWVWKPYWGWVWVSNEPWGWTPYHYGRWVMIDGVWAWWPGPVTVTYVPVWAPAYVAFFDFHHRHHPRPGHVAWLPLGPADWCHPWWSRHNGKRPGGPGPARVEAALSGKFGRVPNAPAMRPLVPPDRGHFSVLASAGQDARIRNAASDLPAQQFGQRQRRSGRPGLDDATFRNANLVVGAAPAMPARSETPRGLGPESRPAGPRPAATGVERAPNIDKPMTRPAVQPSAITPQKIPSDRDGNNRPERAVTPRDDSAPAIRREPGRPLPTPSAPPAGERQSTPATPAPAVTVIRPPTASPPPAAQPREREFRREPASPVVRPPQVERPVVPTRPTHVEPPRSAPQVERPVAPARPTHVEPPRSAPQVERPVAPARPTHVEPPRSAPQVERPVAPARPAHVEPGRPMERAPVVVRPTHVEPARPSSPPAQMQRQSAPAHVERPSAPPPQMQRQSAPARVERPSTPPPAAAPPQRAAPAAPAPRNNAPQKNCGPKPCS
jgi:hypothetical protein